MLAMNMLPHTGGCSVGGEKGRGWKLSLGDILGP
jgi:hypothetical protein